jgi:hypothetical protein
MAGIKNNSYEWKRRYSAGMDKSLFASDLTFDRNQCVDAIEKYGSQSSAIDSSAVALALGKYQARHAKYMGLGVGTPHVGFYDRKAPTEALEAFFVSPLPAAMDIVLLALKSPAPV